MGHQSSKPHREEGKGQSMARTGQIRRSTQAGSGATRPGVYCRSCAEAQGKEAKVLGQRTLNAGPGLPERLEGSAPHRSAAMDGKGLGGVLEEALIVRYRELVWTVTCYSQRTSISETVFGNRISETVVQNLSFPRTLGPHFAGLANFAKQQTKCWSKQRTSRIHKAGGQILTHDTLAMCVHYCGQSCHAFSHTRQPSSGAKTVPRNGTQV